MRGRKPSLIALDGRAGNTSRRPKKSAHSKGPFDPPYKLGPIAQKEWDRIRAEAPWIHAASAGLLAMRCVTFEDWQKVRAEIAAAKEPDWRLHQRERDAKLYILRADTELGLTACSQTKVSGPPRAAVDAQEEAIA